MICADCGTVTERLLGWGRGQRWRNSDEKPHPVAVGPPPAEHPPPPPPPPPSAFPPLAAKRIELRTLLDILRLESDSALEEALAVYRAVYGDRRPRSGFRPSRCKEKVATAFAVYRTLVRSGGSRPLHFVTELCGLTTSRPLLNLRRSLCLGPEDGLDPSLTELPHVEPQDYVDVLCANLGIPFHIASRAHALAEEVRWTLYGRHPAVITAAVLHHLLGDRPGGLSDELSERICSELDCQRKAVASALARLASRRV